MPLVTSAGLHLNTDIYIFCAIKCAFIEHLLRYCSTNDLSLCSHNYEYISVPYHLPLLFWYSFAWSFQICEEEKIDFLENDMI
jgi:hypothetical protein